MARTSRPRRRQLDLEVRGRINPAEIVSFMARVSAGEAIDGERPTLQDRMTASTWLLDRGWGKAVQPVRITAKGVVGVPLPVTAALAALWLN